MMSRVAEFVDAATDKTFVTVNPTSEEPIATFQAATEADVNQREFGARDAGKEAEAEEEEPAPEEEGDEEERPVKVVKGAVLLAVVSRAILQTEFPP